MLVALNGEYGAFYDIVKIKRNGSTIRDVPKSVERVSMEESSSINSIRDNAKNVKGNGQNSDKRFSLMNNGIIAIELNTVKDINSKNTKYNLVVSAFSVKDNYVRNLLQKRADSVEYTKKDLSQLKPQLYEWLASVNERSNGSSQVNHQLHESLAIINEKSDGFGKQLRNNSTTASSEVLNEGISRSNSPKREGVEPISSNGNTSTARAAGTADGSSSASDGDVSTNSIRDNAENVKRNGQNSDKRFSLADTDSQGSKLSAEQREFFENSKIRDASNRLLSLYHGSNAYEEIHVFRRGKSGYLGGGIYLTDSEDYARRYADKNGYKGRIYNVYANAENPLVVTTDTPAKEILHTIYRTDSVYNRRIAKQANEASIITSADIKKLRDAGYDAIVWEYGNSTEVSVFEANQIKLTSNKTPTINQDVRYSLSAIDDYTEKQYNDYGWVRVNDVLSDREYADFNRKMNNLSAEIRRSKTANGEYIIPVNDMKGERFGVDNVLVFAKGTYQNPKITRVIRIGFEDKTYNNETNLTILREYIYEQERQDNEYASIIEDVYPQAIISRYTKGNIPSYQESKIERRRRSSGSESGGIDGTDREIQDGRGDSRSDQRDVRYSVSQSRDENYVNNRLKNYTYSDVDKIVENLTINKYGDDVVLRHKGNIGLADFQESIRRQKAEKTYIFISFALRA